MCSRVGTLRLWHISRAAWEYYKYFSVSCVCKPTMWPAYLDIWNPRLCPLVLVRQLQRLMNALKTTDVWPGLTVSCSLVSVSRSPLYHPTAEIGVQREGTMVQHFAVLPVNVWWCQITIYNTRETSMRNLPINPSMHRMKYSFNRCFVFVCLFVFKASCLLNPEQNWWEKECCFRSGASNYIHSNVIPGIRKNMLNQF